MFVHNAIRFLLILGVASAPATMLADDLLRASPDSQGVDTEKVLEFIDAADKKVNSMHSFMMLRNGKVVAEAWWAPESSDKPHVLWSLSKSFTSTAVGFAVAEGKLAVEVANGSNATSDWNQGYGYQFWCCRHGAYRGDGKDGQFCIVMPKQSAVVVITANTMDMQSELNLVWEHLLPAIHETPLPENPEMTKKLSELTSGLKATR